MTKHLAYLICLSLGCVGTETGNPITTDGTTSDSMTAALVATPGAPVVEEVWISIEGVRAILGDDCDHLGRLVGPTAGDLLTMLRLVSAREMTTCGIHIATTPANEGVGPISFAGATGLIRGRRADGVPFEVRTTTTSAFTVEGLPGIDLRSSHVLSFDVALWLGVVDLSVEPDPDGIVRVEHVAFDAAWPHAASLYADHDGDGLLDADERARPPVASSHR